MWGNGWTPHVGDFAVAMLPLSAATSRTLMPPTCVPRSALWARTTPCSGRLRTAAIGWWRLVRAGPRNLLSMPGGLHSTRWRIRCEISVAVALRCCERCAMWTLSATSLLLADHVSATICEKGLRSEAKMTRKDETE